MHHEMLETEIDYDEQGRFLHVWRCACGRQGTGSLKRAQAMIGFRRHLKQAAKRERY